MKKPSARIMVWIDSIMIFLTVGVLSLLVIEEAVEIPKQFVSWFVWGDIFICSIFLTEFCFQLHWAENKKQFWKRHWIDLLASIPFQGVLQNLRWGRMVRLVRLARVFRGARIFILFLRVGVRVWDHYRGSPTRFSVILMLFSIAAGAVGVMFVELYFLGGEVDGITSLGDALWWALVTVSTVGYGDLTPATAGGRVVATMLIIIGVGLYASFNAILASELVKYVQKNKEDHELEKIDHKLTLIQNSLDELKKK